MIQPMRRLAIALWRDRSGATAIEYGLIAALIFVTALGAMVLMGERATQMFEDALTLIANALG